MNLSQATSLIDILHGPPLSILSSCLRGFLISKPGHDLIAADFSAVESRVLNWLAGQNDILDIYRGHGKIYEYNAAGIYHVPLSQVTKDQRQIGKVAELALGFGGGKRAFQAMAKNYGVKVSSDEAEAIKLGWRAAHPFVVKYWYSVEEAALRAVANPGTRADVIAGNTDIVFRVSGSWLWCRLPSGRVLCYPYPKIEQVETPWGALKDAVTYMGVNSLTKKWERQKTYGGSLVENITQAVARDLLAPALAAMELKGYPVVFHSHDEIICEVPEKFGSVKEMEETMCVLPRWASTLPIAASGWRGKRYRK